MTDKIFILTTAASEQDATKMGQALVERRLAACVNIMPKIQSIYRWKDRIEQAEEWLLLIKTLASREEDVRKVISELHSYELPEFVVIPIWSGSEAYLEW